MRDDLTTTSVEAALFGDVSGLIDSARQRAAVAVNSELVMLYWSVGKRVREEVLRGKRAEYGQRVIATLAAQLTARYGRGWSRRNLERMVHLAEWINDSQKCATLSRKLSWSHFAELLGISDAQKRDFYVGFAFVERLPLSSVRPMASQSGPRPDVRVMGCWVASSSGSYAAVR